MDYQSALAISAAGMTAEKLRVDVSAMNLANANSALSPTGAGYQPLRVQVTPGLASRFDRLVDQGVAAQQNLSVVPYKAPVRKVHEPGHPLADKQGFVRYPGVDPLAEMMTLMVASRAYEADIAAFNIAKTLALRALDIGGKA